MNPSSLFNRTIHVSKELLDASKGLLTLGVITASVNVKKIDSELWTKLQEVGEVQKKKCDPNKVELIPGIKSLRETYKALGLKISDYKGSNESLLRRILAGKGLYQINTVVDINNLVSVDSLRSIGSYDLSKLKGDIIFRRGGEKETYTGTTKRALGLKDLPVLADEEGPFGSPTSDSSRALIQEETTGVMTVIFSFDGEEGLRTQVKQISTLFEQYANAKDINTLIVKDKKKSLTTSDDLSESASDKQEEKVINLVPEIKKEENKPNLSELPKDDKNETKLGMTAKKFENFSDWYTEVIIKAELIDYYDISGCYILRPDAYAIWESLQKHFDIEIKKVGVVNSYFPLFVSEKVLFKEKEHVEGFSPEVAWVTRYSTTELAQPIAIRPTSETIMYTAYSKWIQSHRDLPLKLNQWTNVVRWEFKDPTPFIRTREFLWQEGHTAHATKEEADEETFRALELYRQIYEELLAIPCIKGIKTEHEKFPGALFTTSIECFIPANGRAVQAATSHNLGQNFAKMFDIQFLDEKNEKKYAWQCSWGFTTRSIGILVMTHGDDKGLVLPPRVAHVQVVIIPILGKDSASQDALAKSEELAEKLKAAGVRAKVDRRDNYTVGWKFNHWELKGVPLRIEIGPKELEKNEVKLVRRNDGAKVLLSIDTNFAEEVQKELEKIQSEMLTKARGNLNERIKEASNWEDFMKHISKGNIVLTPWCNEPEFETEVKIQCGNELKGDDSVQLKGAPKTLCIPLDQDPIKDGEKCFFTGKKAMKRVLWGRSY